MVHRLSFFLFVFLLGAFFPVTVANADSWSLPEPEKYYSANRKFCLEVIPKRIESQLRYFRDKVDEKDNAGAALGETRTRATGVFYMQGRGGYVRKAEFQLTNEVAPVSAVVSDNGDYFATFGNWHGIGYGDDAVAIFRSNGTLVRKYALSDLLTEEDIAAMPHSVSSIRWGGEHEIDAGRGLLVLKVFVSRGISCDDCSPYEDLKIELATGRPLAPKHSFGKHPKFLVEAGVAPETPEQKPSEPVCPGAPQSFADPALLHISSEAFFAAATARPVPDFPAIAKSVRVSGVVVLEAVISPTGDVICLRVINGPPLLRQAAIKKALEWKFKPFERGGTAASAIGRIAITFTRREQ